MTATETLFAWCRMPDDVGDHRFYLAGAAAILDEYPQAVRDLISDPRTGTRLIKPFPSLHDLRAACDKAFEPIERDMERQAAAQRAANTRALAGPDHRKRTVEEQARIDALVMETRKAFGLPPEGLRRSGSVPAQFSTENVAKTG